MATWAHSDVLDNGIAYIKANATALHLISSYTTNDSYATVLSRSLGSVAMAAADFTIGSSGANRTLTSASGKTANATASSGVTPDLHFAFVNTASSKVLWITNETTDQPITNGNPLQFPALTYTVEQPT